jgi:hypothetical protein
VIIVKKYIITRIHSASFNKDGNVVKMESNNKHEVKVFDSREAAANFIAEDKEYFYTGAIIQEIDVVTFE